MELFEAIPQFFAYTFLVRALIVGLLVSLCASLLGVSLVLKRFSMIGDGLSHVGFGSLAVATAFNWAPLAVSIPVVIVAAFLLLRLSERGRIKGDAAIALISASALAFGVFVVSKTTGMNTDVDNYLFGSILALTHEDVVLSVVLSLVVLIVFALFYHRIFAVTFDETYARATGVSAGFYNTVLALLTALTIVLGMRMMGALLISSLVIFPALSSMWLCKRFSTVTICAAVVSLICYIVGLFVSFVYQTPTGASIVLANLAVFILFYALSRLATLIPRKRP
jgi:zinc transport system permease protein